MIVLHIIVWFLAAVCLYARYPLPDNLLSLNSQDGQKLLTECLHDDQKSFTALIVDWEAQSNPTYCGVASSVCVLNALNIVGPNLPGFPLNFTYFSQNNLLSIPEVAKAIPEQIIRSRGMTLDVLSQVLKLSAGFAVNVDMIRADTGDISGFRERVSTSVYGNTSFILINYDRNMIKQKGGGHISPIGAYHPYTDQVLILDVAKFKYDPIWIPIPDLFQALNTTDPVSNLTRGYIVVTI